MTEFAVARTKSWRTLGALVVAGAVIALLLLWSFSREVVRRQEDDAIARQSAENLNEARTRAELMARALRDIELQAVVLAAQVREHGAASVNLAAHHEQMRKALPQVFQVTLNDAAGNMLSTSREVQHINIADREHFSVHTGRDMRELFIGRPVQWRSADKRIVPVTYRVNDRQGRFAGVLTFAIDPEFFARQCAGTLSEGETVSVVRNDGVVLTSCGYPQGKMQPGDDIGQSPGMVRVRGQSAGFFVSSGTLDGVRKVMAFETVGGFPVMLRVGTPLEQVLAPVARSARINNGIAGVLALVLLGACLAAVWMLRRQAAVATELDASRHRAESALALKAEAEGRLRAERDRARTYFDSAAPIMVLVDVNGRVAEINVQGEQVLGYARGELLGRNWFETCLPAEVGARVAQSYQRQLARGARAAETYENTVITKTGETRRVRWYNTMLRGDVGEAGASGAADKAGLGKGGVIGVLASGVDITEAAQMRQELQDTQARLTLALRSADMGVGHWDMQTNRGVFDPRVCELLGLDARSFGGTAAEFFAAVHPADRRTLRQTFRRAVQEESLYEAEYRAVWPDGTIRHLATRGRTLRDAVGGVRLAGILWDITERKRAEESTKRTEADLRLIIDTVPALVAYVDTQFRFRRVSRVYEQWWQRSASQIIGTHMQDILGSAWEQVRQYGEAALRGQANEFDTEIDYADGVRRWVHLTYTPDIDDTGTVRGFVVLGQDMTALRRSQEYLMRAQKMESLGTLAAGVAHNFNNIMSAINGNAWLALQDLDAAHPARTSVEEIAKSGRRASDLVMRILDLSRVGQARKPELLALHEVLTDVLNMLRPTLPKTAELKTSLHGELPPVRADMRELSDCIVNLVSNAAQALGSRPGRIALELDAVELEPGTVLAKAMPDLRTGRYARISVSDTGAGMDAQTAQRAFDAFYSTRPVGEGLGLGLSIVHGVMQRHGGTVTVDSAPGAGATFRLYFPAADGSEPPPAGPAPTLAPPRGLG